MTVQTRQPTRTMRHRAERAIRKRRVVRHRATAPVHLVHPKGTRAAVQRGRRLAAEVRKELAVLDHASLDDAMRSLRGRRAIVEERSKIQDADHQSFLWNSHSHVLR
jgi:hypothetical protein